MNAPTTHRTAASPAYYLGRPASRWLAATRRDRSGGSDETAREQRRAHPPSPPA